MKTAFLFSGQGAQYTGMGQELYETHEVMKQTVAEASDILGYDLAAICFDEANSDLLNQTEYTQPAILTISVGLLRLLEAEVGKPDAVAGLSLGEYTALVASGALSFADGVALVAKRGAYMANAAPQGTGKMVAVMNADPSLIEDCCQKASSLGIVAPANYNTPQQIVIGGAVAAVDQAVALLTAQGVKRMIDLKVSGPFHTALLKPAAEQLKEALAAVNFDEMTIPVISNTTAQIMPKDAIKDLLQQQVMSPVRFYESVATLKELGVQRAVEIGPGKTLSGFMKKIDKTIAMTRVEDAQTLADTIAVLKA